MAGEAASMIRAAIAAALGRDCSLPFLFAF